MSRSQSHLGMYSNRSSSLHKPGTIPFPSRNNSPIISNRHKYELKQKIWQKQSIESWFETHTSDDRRAVYSFLNTLYSNQEDDSSKKDGQAMMERRRKSSAPRLSRRINTPAACSANGLSQQQPLPNGSGHKSRASRRDLGEVLESLESFRKSPSVQDKGIQMPATPVVCPLPDVHGAKTEQTTEKPLRRSVTALDKYKEVVEPQNPTGNATSVNDDEANKSGRRYLSHTWRVINPLEDFAPNVRPENNSSSFFNYTKKVYPEYFFIHPDWY